MEEIFSISVVETSVHIHPVIALAISS